MYGRDGMLAHSYLLGPSGESNGCVSFTDYPAFLNAFLRWRVTRRGRRASGDPAQFADSLMVSKVPQRPFQRP